MLAIPIMFAIPIWYLLSFLFFGVNAVYTGYYRETYLMTHWLAGTVFFLCALYLKINFLWNLESVAADIKRINRWRIKCLVISILNFVGFIVFLTNLASSDSTTIYSTMSWTAGMIFFIVALMLSLLMVAFP